MRETYSILLFNPILFKALHRFAEGSRHGGGHAIVYGVAEFLTLRAKIRVTGVQLCGAGH